MQIIFTIYPPVPWKQGWVFSSGPEDATRELATGQKPGELISQKNGWHLQLVPESTPVDVRLLANGLAVNTRKRPETHHLDALLIEPGVLRGFTIGFPLPVLRSENKLQNEENITLLENENGVTLLLEKENHFALVIGAADRDEARFKAEAAIEMDFEALACKATVERERTTRLLGINPRHNPPIALAAEQFRRRLRAATPHIHGLWSCAEGFEEERFSLNELYPLAKAWALTDPSIARQLMQTALSLQQNNGGFPAWAAGTGPLSAAAPWPMLAQIFELVWKTDNDPLFLNKNLPALRKYMQWAIRHFDPQRSRMPTWQNTQEIFVPGEFEHGKATPELTVMLLEEIDALRRLCAASDLAESATASLEEDRDNLHHALDTVFWNPNEKAFSNIWKDGHILHSPSFGSFLPLLYRELDISKRKALLDQFETTHGFPGDEEIDSWKREQVADTVHLPAIHQFIAFCALQIADANRAMLLLFVRRAREGFAAWFEHESIEAARLLRHDESTDKPAFELGPIVSALILVTQEEFQIEVGKRSSSSHQLQRILHTLRITKSDLRIAGAFLLAILFVHLIYNLPKVRNADAQLNEAVINYKQGDMAKVVRACRRHPEHPLAQFLTANLQMRSAQPAEAEKLYRSALLQEPGSPSALLGLALSLQLTGRTEEAIKRYTDFFELYAEKYPTAGNLALGFRTLAEEQFSRPPRWEQVFALPLMDDLGL